MVFENRHLSLRELRSFCVAAELGSFRAAADRLFITPSAVSYQIKSLEEQFGRKLFARSARSLKLTAIGTEFLAEIKPLVVDLDQVFSRHRQRSTRTALRISVQPFFASELFVPRLSHLADTQSDLDISVDTSNESSETHPPNADVSIRVFKSPPGNLRCDKLFPLRLAPAGSPDFYDSIKVVAGRVVSDMPLLIHESRPTAWRDWQDVSGIRIAKDQTSVTLDSMIAIARAAEQGVGAALMPLLPDKRWFGTSKLVHLFETDLATDEAYYLISDPSEENAAIGMLREWVLQEFGGYHA